VKSRAPPQLRVADHLANSKSRSPLPRTVRPSLAEVIWSLVSSGSIVLGSCLEFPSTVAVSSLEDRSTAGSRPSVTVSSPENHSTAGILSFDPRQPSTVSVSSTEDRSKRGSDRALLHDYFEKKRCVKMDLLIFTSYKYSFHWYSFEEHKFNIYSIHIIYVQCQII